MTLPKETTMIEKCVEAMRGADQAIEFGGDYSDLARAVLTALRDPTPEMVEAGRWPAEDDGPLACWKAMIDQALNDRALSDGEG